MNEANSGSPSRQRGYSTIAMVMLLMLFGTLMLKGLNAQLTTQVKIYGDERRYLRAYNQALSSIDWALSQRWNARSDQWLCRVSDRDELSACVREMEDSTILIRGAGQLNYGEPNLALFQLSVRRDSQQGEDDGASALKRVAHGYIDFCPLAMQADCDLSVEPKAKLSYQGER
ncbi:YgdB family protein [Budvicia diplopodorum]|uniref:YgdB family protein n=1 Tax=Budvicia diplopodorum TaxID=1119056 RepID=UPI0013569F75|nr:YgdB family protein [Budvicia diplopodorum]